MSKAAVHRGMFPALRRATLALLGFVLLTGTVAGAEITVYKTPACGCCKGWVQHLRADGFRVQTVDVGNVMPYKERFGIPQSLMSCHTAIVGGYVIEGHVPVQEMRRLLRERPNIKGLAVPGMPMGSPGMEGARREAYQVVSFDERGRLNIYAHYE